MTPPGKSFECLKDSPDLGLISGEICLCIFWT
jgi:hypothetical protein